MVDGKQNNGSLIISSKEQNGSLIISPEEQAAPTNGMFLKIQRIEIPNQSQRSHKLEEVNKLRYLMAMVPFTIPQMVVPSTIPQMVSDFSLHYTANIYRKWLLQMVSNGYTTNGYTANGFKWFPPLYRKWFQMVPSTIPQVVSNGYTANGFKWLYRKWLYRKWLYRKWFQMVPSTIPQMVSDFKKLLPPAISFT